MGDGAGRAVAQRQRADVDLIHARAEPCPRRGEARPTHFAFNYDLATPPPVAEVGLNMFQKFMNDASNVDGLMDETQKAAADAFKELEQLSAGSGARAGRFRCPPVLRRLH